MSLKDQYAIVGIGYTSEQGHIPRRIALSSHAEACSHAIKDALQTHACIILRRL
jgi:hypothetical protein